MANWVIRGADPNWKVLLADCDAEHAQSVLETLEQDASMPSDLQLKKMDELYDGGEKKRGLFRRRKR
jgi:hypothetical protein